MFRGRYKAIVVDASSYLLPIYFYTKKHTPTIMGDEAFKETALAHVMALDAEVDKSCLAEPVIIDRIVEVVAGYYQVPASSVLRGKRGVDRNLPRWIAMPSTRSPGLMARLSTLPMMATAI
jgi:hypothetical protein